MLFILDCAIIKFDTHSTNSDVANVSVQNTSVSDAHDDEVWYIK